MKKETPSVEAGEIAADHRSDLIEIYRKYCPEKVEKVDALLERFHGREAKLLEMVKAKYGKA